jgi:hypothetical protein
MFYLTTSERADDDREEGQYGFDEKRPEIVFSEQMLGKFGYLFNAIVQLPINVCLPARANSDVPKTMVSLEHHGQQPLTRCVALSPVTNGEADTFNESVFASMAHLQ